MVRLDLSSVTRAATLRKASSMVWKVAPRQWKRLGGQAPQPVDEPVGAHAQERTELVGLPSVAGGAV
jgi:hypothetical protein